MRKFKVTVTLLLISTALIGSVSADEDDTSMQSELENALSHMRMVVRNGIKVKGTYSYSDGQFRKTIYYIADNKGYRITGEDIVPLSDSKPLRINYDDEYDSTEAGRRNSRRIPYPA